MSQCSDKELYFFSFPITAAYKKKERSGRSTAVKKYRAQKYTVVYNSYITKCRYRLAKQLQFQFTSSMQG